MKTKHTQVRPLTRISLRAPHQSVRCVRIM
jgi:hypothetical protein